MKILKLINISDLIYEVGLILLEKACKYIKRLTKEYIGSKGVIINISSIQLDDKRFYYDLDRVIEIHLEYISCNKVFTFY